MTNKQTNKQRIKDEGRGIETDTETKTETETQIERGLENEKCQYPSSNESLELLGWVLRQPDRCDRLNKRKRE